MLLIQEKIKTERPTRPILGLAGGSQGTQQPVLVDGRTKDRDPRGPGYGGTYLRGASVTPPFWESRSRWMWTPPPRRIELGERDRSLVGALREKFGDAVRQQEPTSDMLTLDVEESRVKHVLRFLKTESSPRYLRLDDLTAVDESARKNRQAYPDYTLVYHLLSFEPAGRLRLKVGLSGSDPVVPTITDIWPSANWYEREVFDLFGIRFEGHPDLRRLLMPHDWEGYPLRKGYPGRATRHSAYSQGHARAHQPTDAGVYLRRDTGEEEFVLNIGPHHLSTHGLMRFIVSLYGEEITALDMDIGYHHRGNEKIGEHQSWHQFIPYTDRVDYLAGAANNFSYVTAVEKLAGIDVPDRAQYIRVMLAEFFRISNHLVWFPTFAHDVGAMTANFYAFRDRERIMDIVEMITGGRLHSSWFRLGGVAMDLPEGWKEPVDDFLKTFPARIKEYEALIQKNPIFRARTRGIGRLTAQQAMEWGVTGPNLRACGVRWDLRKNMPYGAYDAFDFDVPTSSEGDCFARFEVRFEEMRQSLRIIAQAADGMPEGRHITDDYRYVVPDKKDTLRDIESLIHHFINATRGPTMPRGEAYSATEVPRGEQGYYVVSDGHNMAYRMRIRGPGFANIQTMPLMAVGGTLSDLIAIAGSIDYILPDIDR